MPLLDYVHDLRLLRVAGLRR